MSRLTAPTIDHTLDALVCRAPATDNLREIAALIQANGTYHLSLIERIELAQRLPPAAGGTRILPADGNAVYSRSALSIPVFVDQLAALLA